MWNSREKYGHCTICIVHWSLIIDHWIAATICRSAANHLVIWPSYILTIVSLDNLVANCGTSWHVANASISSPYRAFSKEKIFANIGVKVGLQSVNITLRGECYWQLMASMITNDSRLPLLTSLSSPLCASLGTFASIATPIHRRNEEINYNERFYWIGRKWSDFALSSPISGSIQSNLKTKQNHYS